MMVLGFSKLGYNFPKTGKDFELFKSKKISLELEFKLELAFETDLSSSKSLNLLVIEKTSFLGIPKKIIVNINWLVRNIDLTIFVPNNDEFKQKFILALHSNKKEALLFKNFKTLKVDKCEDDKRRWVDYSDKQMKLFFQYSNVDVPCKIKKFFKEFRVDKREFLIDVETWFIYQVYELTTKFGDLIKYIEKSPGFEFESISQPDAEYAAAWYLEDH
jgi:hypothetical protein